MPFNSAVLHPNRTALVWDGAQDKGLNRGFRYDRLAMNFVSCTNQNYSFAFIQEELYNERTVDSKRGTPGDVGKIVPPQKAAA